MRRWIPFVKSPPLVAVIRLSGLIAAGNRVGALNDQALAPVIERAFRRGKPDAVALELNSPGGSPVQSALIAARIRRLAGERGVKVYAFVEDVAASGGYWLACAADEIWVDESSIVGSIGVISAGFGFHDFITRHGIERRLYTAGKSKARLDPFLPEKPEDVARLRELQDSIHAAFIEQVKSRRGSRLSDDPRLFEGEVWTGRAAVDLGLADGLGHLVPKMKEILGDKTRFLRYGPRRPFLGRLGAQAAEAALSLAEERAAYARLGL
ncbi:serine protease SohB [Meinhardsimonia xiamenensis]|jgi:serine protease SohB|uniref:Serine protease SohB n=1 Tax=Meinhardsimonia xiamenensis TaxID=990712 RepID=A0A1G9E7T3_9RHOB|nr:S49 family peptidase [Meinhardsimonia xiamenensis]PRX33891.1 serine protease SohB [Meinhardsimonia xiamenensis]SDK72192.1 serine protease SohB [Meinhardsimonia xiamenensis]